MAQQRMRTHTEYDYEHLLELQRVLARALTYARTTKRRVANGVLGLAALVLAGVLIAFQKDIIFIVLLVGVGVYFAAWSLFFYPIAALVTLRNLKPSQTACDYYLERNYMLVTNAYGKDGQQYRYEECLCLLETEGNLYFILKDGRGVVLDKANLKGGSVDQLRAWLEEKSGQKVRWMGKKSAPDGE